MAGEGFGIGEETKRASVPSGGPATLSAAGTRRDSCTYGANDMDRTSVADSHEVLVDEWDLYRKRVVPVHIVVDLLSDPSSVCQ